jgi:octaheme c-type cytochrome (tetrathionate reductase family)
MGNGMTCQDCHTSESHQIQGRSMAIITDEQNRVECVNCHQTPAHPNKILDNHSGKVACQTCHIPVFAKDRPTKIYWDWSTAGMDTILPEDDYGMPTYDKKKGTFTWGQNLQPEYYWYNGKSDRYLKGEKIHPEELLALNIPLGEHEDKNARIYPFKVMRGKQIYDSEYDYLIIPQLWGGFWKHFDWNRAARDGMTAAGLPYSGNYGWVKTEMYWKLNHMVSPKEQALKCMVCHGKGNEGRLDWKQLGYDGDPQNK